MLRQALAEQEEKPIEEIASALIGELFAIDDLAGALTASLDVIETAPAAAISGLRRLTPELRPTLLAPVADRLSPPRWIELLTNGWRSQDDRRDVVAFLAGAHLLRGDFGAVINLVEKTRPAVGDDAELCVFLGEAYLGLRAPTQALAAFQAADELVPRDASSKLQEKINLRLAELDEQLGRPDEALRRLDSMSPADLDSAAERLALRALCLLQLGDIAAAKEAYTAAQRESPNLLIVARAGALVFLAANEYDEAIRTADAGLAANPEAQSLSFLRFQAIVEAGQDVPHIERRLSRFLARLDPAERGEYVAASSRVRRSDDAALRYFLGMVRLATGERDRALNEVDSALGAINEADNQSPSAQRIEVLLRRLRAILLEPDSPEDAAVEYATAGQLAFTQGDTELTIELIGRAAARGELDQASRWVLADAHYVASFAPGEPKDVSVEHLQQALKVWQEALDRERPKLAFLWAYVSRARMSLKLAQIETEVPPRACEALLFCESFYVLNLGTEAFFDTFSDASRLLGLYGLSTQLLSVAGEFEKQAYESQERLLTSAINAGDITLLRDLLPIFTRANDTGLGREAEARVLILTADPRGALAALDAVAPKERSGLWHLWWRIQSHWQLGNRTNFEAEVAKAADIAQEYLDGPWKSLAAWVYLLAGRAERAADMFATCSTEDSWITDVDAEKALCSLAMGDTDTAEPVIGNFIADCRSFEDIHVMAFALDVIRWRYANGAGGRLIEATRRLKAAADARAASDRWPLDARRDLEHLLATSSAAGRDAAITVGRAGLARLSIERGEWSTAISHYGALLSPPDRFPELEAGLIWLASSLRKAYAEQTEVPLAATAESLSEALAELRRVPRGRVDQLPLEVYIGDIRMDMGDADSTRSLYSAALALLDDREEYAHVAARRHVAMVLLAQSDTYASLRQAAMACAAAGRSLAAALTKAANELVRSESQWRQVTDAWAPDGPALYGDDGDAAQDPDVRRDIKVAAAVARQELARILFREGRFDEAETEFRAVVEARRRVLGDDDPATRLARYNLAGVLQKQGRLDEAEAEYRAVLDSETRTQGAEDPSTLITRHELARILFRLGRFDEAETELRAVVEARRRVLGDDDPDTVDSRLDLARTLSRDRRPDEALAAIEEAASIYRTLAEAHPDAFRDDLARSLDALGNALSAVGRDAHARVAHDEADDLRRKS